MAALSMNIFDLGDELDKIALAYDQLADGGTEEEFLAAIENYFGDLLNQRDAKLDNYARLIATCDAKAKARREEAARLSKLATTDANLAERLKARLKTYFEVAGIQQIETSLHKFALQANGGALALDIDDECLRDPALLPEDYRETVTQIVTRTDKIRESLEAGVELPFARLRPRGTHVRIR